MTDEDAERGAGAVASMALLGEIAWLLMQAPPHRDWPLGEVARAFLAPAAHGQLRIWRRGARPVGVAAWAWLDAPREAAFLKGVWSPGPDDWRCGSRPVAANLVAPFGDGARIALELRRSVFPGLTVRALRIDAHGRPTREVAYPPYIAGRPVARPVRQRTAPAAALA
jgi:cytolysin-activating lysine-acyltransferase